MIISLLKYLFFFLLTLLLGATPTHAKTELVLPQKQVVFSIEQTPKASTLEKEVQPNVGFLLEKTKFVAIEGISAVKTFAFAECVGGKLAQGVDDLFSSFTHLKNLPTEAKTFLSAKNWDNAILTKLDGDLAITTFKNAVDVNPQLIDAWKKLDNLNVSPAFRRNIDNLNQRSILDDYAGNISTASNARKGNFGEIGADLDLNAKGYESLQPRITGIDDAGHNGLDGVYRKNGQYYIVEGKYTGSASLNPENLNTGLPRQMSDNWIATRNWDDINLDPSIVENLLETKNYQRVLAKVAPDGSVTYKLIDTNGYVITGNAGVFNP